MVQRMPSSRQLWTVRTESLAIALRSFQPVIPETAGSSITERAFVTAEGKEQAAEPFRSVFRKKKVLQILQGQKPAKQSQRDTDGFSTLQKDLNRHGLYLRAAKSKDFPDTVCGKRICFSKEDGWWSRNRVPVYRTTMISEVSIPYMASTGLPGFLFPP